MAGAGRLRIYRCKIASDLRDETLAMRGRAMRSVALLATIKTSPLAMKTAMVRFLAAAVAIVLVANHAFAQEQSCDPAVAARREVGKLQGSGKSDEQQLVLPCGLLVATARVRGQEIGLSVSEPSGQPLYNVADATAFALYAPLVARVLAEAPGVDRWTLSVRGYQSFGPRLAAAAARDEGWNARTGKPRHDGPNAYVVAIANRARIFAEVQQIAGENNRNSRVISAEKVVLCPDPVEPRDRVPCGALVWFELSK